MTHNRLGHRFQRRLDVPVWLERGPQGAAFSPADIDGLLLWLEGDAVEGLNDGDSLSPWLDISGNGHSFAWANPPTWRENILNGLPVARFDGVNDQLRDATPVQQDPLGSVVTVTIWRALAAAKSSWQAFGANRILTDFGAGNTIRGETEGPVFGGTGYLAIAQDAPYVDIFRWDFDADIQDYRNNGTDAVQGALADMDPATIWLLGTADGVSFSQIDQALVLLYDHYLTLAEMTAIQNFYNSKYALGI